MDVITLDSFDSAADQAYATLDAPVEMIDVVRVQQGGRCALGFGLFVLLNAVLFVRPAELVPDWEGLPIYQVIIVACLLASWPVVLPQLSWTSLKQNPITLCVVGLFVAVVLSHLRHKNIYDTWAGADAFIKVVIYYLLLVGLLDSRARIRLFLKIITGLVFVTAALSLLNHHGLVHIDALDDLLVGYNPNLPPEQQNLIAIRLRAMGIFNDPNDFCLILNFAVFVCLHWTLQSRNHLLKIAWALPIIPLGYALFLTESRGGFLSLVAGLIAMLFTRLPRRRAMWLAGLMLPLIFVLFAGRSTNIDVENKGDTAQGRIHLWGDSLIVFHHWPVFGIGENMLVNEIGMVSHNSYVHAYAELGFFGGTLFFGAFYLAFLGFRSLSPRRAPDLDEELASLRLCLIPCLAAYMMGMYSLSRDYVNVTYMVSGIAAAMLALARQEGFELPTFNRRLVKNVVWASVGCVLYFEIFVRIFVNL